MKYELETIPIWDTYELDSECPLCILEERAEERYIDFFLGNSVMAPEMRVEVNKSGFCPKHNRKLFVSEKNRHGLGLISHTHMKTLLADIEKSQKALINSTAPASKLRKLATVFLDRVDNWEHRCMICNRLDYTMKRYAFTIVYLWNKKEDFAEKYAQSKGFCLHHLPYIFEMAADLLHAKRYTSFIVKTLELQQASLGRLESELLWYTQKFDYQNNDKPWGTARDALNRALQKITGLIMHDRAGR